MSRKSRCKSMDNMYCCPPQPMCCAPQPKPQVMCCVPEPQAMCCMMPGGRPGTCGMQQGTNKSFCSFPCLIILILVLLVFGNSGRSDCDDPCSRPKGPFGLDNGILFIIVLFYLCCVIPQSC